MVIASNSRQKAQSHPHEGETHMKKYLPGLTCSILAIASIFYSMLPMQALAAPPDNSEPLAQNSLSSQSNSGPELEASRNDRTRESIGRLTESQLHDLLVGASTGTAWPISSGYVVTNNHVVSKGSSVVLISAQGREIPARVVLIDEAADIVLLEVKDLGALPPALPLAQSEARLGASVFTIGFPRVDLMGSTPKISVGVISGEKGLRDDPQSYQTTVPIQPGNSGGPLLNMKGEVVGLVRSMLGIRDEANGSLQILQNTSCALKVKGIQELLPLLPQKDPRIYVLPNLSDDLETLASRIKDSVLIVISR
jgi:S1-C subfamily serine protease